jgi:hypothetical protein
MNTLIVMRLADMTRVHPHQDESRVCSRCGERVGIYPSGQRALAAVPDLEIVCHVCCDPGIGLLAPGAETEPFESKPK